jgi:hypothetical protein
MLNGSYRARRAFPLDEWLGPKGAHWRACAGHRKPAVGAGFMDGWHSFRNENIALPRTEIENLLEAEHNKVRAPAKAVGRGSG